MKLPEYSRRTAWDTTESPLASALRQRQEQGLPLADLTASNPTRCGFAYPETLLEPLSSEAALHYDPNPRGLYSARQSVCGYYRGHAAALTEEQIFLTTSTSEAYSYLFRLLCDAGDEVLLAQPSYPLFDFLARLDDIRLVSYPLIYDYGWQLDLSSLRSRITPRTRAIALVHPNNPTGHFLKRWEREALEEICLEFGLSLIVDEVFLDYPFPGTVAESFTAGRAKVPTFVLSGLSKIAGLPQMKVSWIACCGEGWEYAAERLEVIADTFLSINAPVQAALPYWLESAPGLQEQIRRRTAQNLCTLDQEIEKSPAVDRLKVEGGWYAILRVPAIAPDEDTAVKLIGKGVSLHPGYFFGFPEAGWLVVSLLASPESFGQGMEILTECLQF